LLLLLPLQHIIYEMHIGSFTPEGTLKSAIDKLPHIASLGFTLLELMPCQEHSDPWCVITVILYMLLCVGVELLCVP
jgi:hypothetical protein